MGERNASPTSQIHKGFILPGLTRTGKDEDMLLGYWTTRPPKNSSPTWWQRPAHGSACYARCSMWSSWHQKQLVFIVVATASLTIGLLAPKFAVVIKLLPR